MSTVVEKAVSWLKAIAQDDSHGYDQSHRWGPDYDCSSLTIKAYDRAGVPVIAAGAGYTGNIRPAFLATGMFKDVTKDVNLKTGHGLRPGDVCLNYVHHVVVYVGDGKVVSASINENGRTTGGKTGDQTGREILIRSYYNYPWNSILRYCGPDADEDTGVVAPAAPTSVQQRYHVQAGSFRKKEQAETCKAQLQAAGIDSYWYLTKGWYVVQAGCFQKKENATAQATKVQKATGSPAWIW